MKRYDVIVIGSGAGMLILDGALSEGRKVALVDKGPLGGTCLNLGCVPSKMLIYAADRVTDIQEARKLGISADIKGIDFGFIMERMMRSRKESKDFVRKSVQEDDKLDFYEGAGRFVGAYIIAVNGERIKGK